ncbi:MAG TPA: carboxypeptidase regulatory-like domain-containing protein [Vicinamibacterales bacterium]|nr:carboxypeptidase regulatory-like domain-containing protein [Vicinamibacterales bacterium]
MQSIGRRAASEVILVDMLRSYRTLGFLLLLTLLAPASADAQVGAGQVTGTIIDMQRAPVPGATVTAVRGRGGAVRTAVSSSSGDYTLPVLPPGEYRIDVELPGFRPIHRKGIRVETGETIRLDFTLVVGALTDATTVTADAPVLRATASLGQIISEEKIAALPLNGRSFITLASLVPGVAVPPASPLPRISGGRPRANEYLFDGISVLQPEPGQVAYFPVVDSIQEFKIETNGPPAEFGRFNGGVVNLTTRSGSNEFHGTAFEFLRDEKLNARNFFAPSPAVKPVFRRNQFGGVLGGPVLRDRTFFFVDYQGQRQEIGRTVTSTVPTLLQRQGVFTESIGGTVPRIFDPATTVASGGGFVRTPFVDGRIPLERMDPVAVALLNRYPLPTSAGTANNFRRTAPEVNDQNQWAVRLDHRFRNNQDSVFGRFTNVRDRFVPVTPLPEGSGVTTGTLGPQNTVSWALATSYQRTFSSTLLNEVRVGDTRRHVTREAAQLATTAGSALSIPGIPSGAQFPNTLPTFLISGYTQLGSPPNTATDFRTSVSEIADTLTWVKGRHTVKGGFDWRWERLNVIQPPSPTGSFTFNQLGSDQPGITDTGSPLASFLLGQVQSFSIDLQTSQIRERARFQEYFVQDDWKVGERLTVTPGVRYTLNFPSTEINGQTAVFDLDNQVLTYPGTEPVRPLKKDNFGPRLGLAYRATDRTLVSAGYGMVWIEMAGITTPFTTPAFPFLQTVTQRALDTINPAFVLQNGPSVAPLEPTPLAGLGQGVFSVAGDLGSGYVQQWNASVQRELTRDVSVEVAYVGSKITRVGIPDTNLNQLTPEQLALGNSLLARVPNPYFGEIPRSSSLGEPTITVAQLLKPFPKYTTVSLYRHNVGNTNYHGLTAKVEQRLARGFSYLASYTRSRLMDDASSVFDASVLTGPVANVPVADSFDRRRERDYSNGDIPHVFVASGVWNVPSFGPRRGVLGLLASDWTLSTIVTLQAGMPIAVTQQTNFNAFAGFGTQRPNLVGDPELPEDGRTTTRWFNTAAFGAAPQFTLGNSSRNPVRGPGYRNVDLAASRRLRLQRGMTLELRAEAFNLLNNPAFGNPNGVLGSAAFGSITTAGDPRVVQLAVKFAY